MSVYDKDGTELFAVFGTDGNELAQAYDISGNPLIDDTSELVVMTYNYQWCTGINSQVAMQEDIIDKYKPDIIGIQEAANRSGGTSFPTIVSQFLADYPYKYLSTQATNKNALASKLAISDYQNILFTETDDELWDYQKCYVEVDGKTIAVYNTHLTYKTDAATLLRKYAQATEFFEDIEQEEYAIVFGDFNMYGLSMSSDDYIGIGKQFADAGYNMANWNNEVGFVRTWTDSRSATSLLLFTYPCDNIITTPNISLKNVVFDTTKFDYLNGDIIDHVPVIAYLSIK